MISVNVHAGYASRDHCRKMLTQVLLLFSAMIATFIPGMNHQKKTHFLLLISLHQFLNPLWDQVNI